MGECAAMGVQGVLLDRARIGLYWRMRRGRLNMVYQNKQYELKHLTNNQA